MKYTLEQVVEMTKTMIENRTGLIVVPLKRHPKAPSVYLHLKARETDLGFTCVTKMTDRSFSVGGHSSGAFTWNGENNGLAVILQPEFIKIQDQVNEEA